MLLFPSNCAKKQTMPDSRYVMCSVAEFGGISSLRVPNVILASAPCTGKLVYSNYYTKFRSQSVPTKNSRKNIVLHKLFTVDTKKSLIAYLSVYTSTVQWLAKVVSGKHGGVNSWYKMNRPLRNQ